MSVFGTFPVKRYYCNCSLLGTSDAFNLLQYAMHNFYFYHCLFGLASRDLQRSKMSPHVFSERFQSDIIMIDHF